ncbi:AAA family ATPase [Candidatus Viridilinea mediisalina]|uniref:ATPase AAA-type core domain-containing protein n=1 Tax=Candidatus Viridilinea mediisalina TaxID=2024553 RepID=A0A2A6RK81_9CHLR|nr:AAA family ATPase [Candidatus Viridilinea mediisalina]PDW03278.1 hypothetical protein CJ255_09535 [Candidatus Viridilinea mediisalina]
MNNLLPQAAALFQTWCNQPRYRTAWLIGGPLAGKTTLAKRLCAHATWRYLNYTLDADYFAQLHDRIETYQVADLLNDLRGWCRATTQPVLLVDELDALFACWSDGQRRLFAHQASRLSDLPCGLILVSNFFEPVQLASLLPQSDQLAYFHLGMRDEG